MWVALLAQDEQLEAQAELPPTTWVVNIYDSVIVIWCVMCLEAVRIPIYIYLLDERTHATFVAFEGLSWARLMPWGITTSCCSCGCFCGFGCWHCNFGRADLSVPPKPFAGGMVSLSWIMDWHLVSSSSSQKTTTPRYKTIIRCH